MKFRFEVLLLGLALLAGAWLLYKKFSPRTGEPAVVAGQTAPGQVDLVEDQRAQVFYKLPVSEQQRLLKAVEHFCGREYHRDSCIHHLATCGFPCMVVVPRDRRKRIFEDYQTLRQQKGLPPLSVLPGQKEE